MDIERLSQIGSTLDTRLKKKRDDEKNRTSKTGKAAFGRVMETAGDRAEAAQLMESLGSLPGLDGTETVEGLLDDVHEAGEALKRDPVFGPLEGYRKAVRKFMKYILQNSLETDRVPGILNTRTMERKEYTVIRVVDEKLESLAAHVLKGQAEQLDILRRIDEIHGLLVDLTG